MKPFENLVEWLKAVRDAEHGPADPRLGPKTDGGFPLDKEWAAKNPEFVAELKRTGVIKQKGMRPSHRP